MQKPLLVAVVGDLSVALRSHTNRIDRQQITPVTLQTLNPVTLLKWANVPPRANCFQAQTQKSQ